jgi:hypothetical protein
MNVQHVFQSAAYKEHDHLNEQLRTAWALLASLKVNSGDYRCDNNGSVWRYDGYADGRYCFSHPNHPARGHILYIKILPQDIARARKQYREYLQQTQESVT